MRTMLGRLGLLALAAAGCGSPSGPAVLHGALAFPVVRVDESPSPVVGEGSPDGGWPGIYLEISGVCLITDGEFQPAGSVMVFLQLWNPDGGPIVAGTWPLIESSADPRSGSASLYYRDLPDGPQDPRAGQWQGMGGSVTFTEVGPVYAGSFTTTINGQGLSGSFSTGGPNQCACTPLPGGGESCPEF
jgi:hypothetical protein